mgnify:CR=1 FL=1
MTSTFTQNKNFEAPGHGDYSNTWDTPVNADWNAIDACFGGTTFINPTGLSGTRTPPHPTAFFGCRSASSTSFAQSPAPLGRVSRANPLVHIAICGMRPGGK